MADIVAFLLARISEDERLARVTIRHLDTVTGQSDEEVQWRWAAVSPTSGSTELFGPGAPAPNQILAECAAKRTIIDEIAIVRDAAVDVGNRKHFATTDKTRIECRVELARLEGRLQILRTAVRAFTRPYAGHPDYDPAWAV